MENDLCDKCMRSGVQVEKVDENGNTVCVDCDDDRRDTVWFVRRACDGRMKCVDGKWRDMVSANRIKFYSSAGRAEKYGLKGCKLVDSVADGSLQTRGTCYAVSSDECVNAVGDIYDNFGNFLRHTR